MSDITVPASESAIVLTADKAPWVGIKYTIGEVSFPDDEEPIMSFDYTIVEGVVEQADKLAFEQYVGDTLVEMIKRGLEERSLIFKGGT